MDENRSHDPKSRGPAWTALILALVWACGDEGTTPVLETADVELAVTGLASLDPSVYGSYEAWAIDGNGTIHSAGRFAVPGPGPATVTVKSPVKNPTDIMITIEPPGDADDRPSELKVMGGRVQGGVAQLDVNRYLTAGIPLEANPGTHVLFTPSDNGALGFPSNEDAGIWVFNIDPVEGVADTLNPNFFLTFTPLTKGWTYEGWVVRDYGSSGEIWLSYGKFEPDQFRKASARDDTGPGPFSGQPDYERALPEEIQFPGDDWVANPHGFPFPAELTLPLDLNGRRDGAGNVIEVSRWTHVITIEPRTDRDEDPWTAVPFFLAPYANPFGEGFPEEPRVVEYHPERLPSGTATIRG